MNIWITGIGGFLGSHLAERLLAAGHDVRGNDTYLCGDPKNVPNGAYCFRIDCTDRQRLYDAMRVYSPDVVIHCAATAHEGLSSFSPAFVTRNIYEASVSTFSAAIAAGAKRIVYMSSMSRYGAQTPPFSEDMPPAPVDPYGVAKVAAEDTLKILAQTHGVAYAIAVPHNIIGIRQRSVDPYRNVAAIMINRCKQGKGPIVYGDGSQKRCFSPVNDCLPSIIAMVDGAGDGEVINIGPDTGTMSILDLAESVKRYTNCGVDITYMPPRPNEVHQAYTTSDKARRLLGYREQQDVHVCLREMAAYIQPAPFVYDFPIEIRTERTPRTWTDRLM